jgi:hypothetical protein
MKQPGRRSAAARAAPLTFTSDPVAILPPANLSEPAKKVFCELVGSVEPEHFEDCDAGLLARYATATVLAEAAESMLQQDPQNTKALATWEKAVRAISGLALRLRIGPQARRERAKVGKPLSWSDRFALEHDPRRQNG